MSNFNHLTDSELVAVFSYATDNDSITKDLAEELCQRFSKLAGPIGVMNHEIMDLYERGYKIQAIKLCWRGKEHIGVSSMREAKEYVENLCKNITLGTPKSVFPE